NLEALVSLLIKYYFNHQKLNGAIKKLVTENFTKFNVNINNLTNQDSFFTWLEDQWYQYIINQDSKLNFDDKKIQYILDNCFEQGYMKKLDLMGENIDIDYIKSKITNNFSFNSGIINFDKLSIKEFFDKEYNLLDSLLDQELNSITWGNIAKKWSHLVYLNENNKLNNDLSGLAKQVDNKFLNFIVNEYDDLVYDQRFQYAPLNNEIIPNLLKDGQKTALICLDGMSYKDWFVVKKYLDKNLDLKYHEHFSYAIIPTITSYSRRAIFSAKTPLEDDGRYDEEKLFKSNIKNKEKLKNQKIFFDRTNEPKVFELLGYKYIGLIYNFIDEIAHQATSERLKFNNLKNFLNESKFSAVINNLLDKNFRVYLCSDHGNLYCEGNGFNPSRDLIEKRASRSVLYRSRELADNEEFEKKLVLNFPNIIGEEYILTMKNRRKFGNSEPGFTHGGVNIEEVIIPFIEVIG
ncbi:MAG: BREX-3 system phosphatase PglZ, partial [bacterium]